MSDLIREALIEMNQSLATARSSGLCNRALEALEVARLAQRDEVERLREALRFYRDAPAGELAMDEGERAKAALGGTEAE